jgi:hypothetical protein
VSFMPNKRKKRERPARAALDHMLTVAVRYDCGCEAFVGVVVPAHSGEVNWTLTAVRCGKADRNPLRGGAIEACDLRTRPKALSAGREASIE